MTRAQYRVYNRLRKKQSNASDVVIVDTGSQYVTFHLAFPGLYLTYSADGHLLTTETEAERKTGNKILAIPGKVNLVIGGEMGSEDYGKTEPTKTGAGRDAVFDDDIPF